ncbi:hypothetical protein GCM10010174_61190 [Kutzneria viridogrisea]|uniref:DUF397 domain-containing protein n=1 Tax=Kutzneria viridogrisea TaxID=47990 RepID=A0ABR6BGF7_9PSEU|nr:hypothetical protein [Kutzneria viridogrisea]
MSDLYKIDLTATASRYCGGNTGDQSGDGQESCVMFAPVPGVDGALALTDSKRPEAGELRFTAAELDAFVTGYVRERGLAL